MKSAHKIYKRTTHNSIMDKVSERVQVSLSESDKQRLEELKVVFNVKTYSKVVQRLIRYGKI
jgi:hypothetical protein